MHYLTLRPLKQLEFYPPSSHSRNLALSVNTSSQTYDLRLRQSALEKNFCMKPTIKMQKVVFQAENFVWLYQHIQIFWVSLHYMNFYPSIHACSIMAVQYTTQKFCAWDQPIHHVNDSPTILILPHDIIHIANLLKCGRGKFSNSRSLAKIHHIVCNWNHNHGKQRGEA